MLMDLSKAYEYSFKNSMKIFIFPTLNAIETIKI